MTATIEPTSPAPPSAEPAPGPPDDGLTDTVRTMRDELAAHYKGANPPSIDKAIEAIRPGSATPDSWGSRGMAGKAVKAYRDSIGGTPTKATGKKPAVRTARTKTSGTVARPVTLKTVRPTPEPEPVPNPPVAVQPPPAPPVRTAPDRTVRAWPVMVIALPAMVAIWGGWVGLGGMTGFGDINLLPGIAPDNGWATINSAITLPIGVEAYAAFALRVWLSGHVPNRAKTFARWSAIGSLVVGALGQVAYHLLEAAGYTSAPWQITTLVACLPVAVLGMAAALVHLMREEA